MTPVYIGEETTSLTHSQASRKLSPSLPISAARTSRRTSNVWTLPKAPSTACTSTFTSRLTVLSSTPSSCARVRSWAAALQGSDKPVPVDGLKIDGWPSCFYHQCSPAPAQNPILGNNSGLQMRSRMAASTRKKTQQRS
jgi:hypothetical protein